MEDGPSEPNAADELWGEFTRAKEENSEHAGDRWSEYRTGLRRLQSRYGHARPGIVERSLAEDAFFCATHWGHSPRIVRFALDRYLDHRIGANSFCYLAVEYLVWARAKSPGDVAAAEDVFVAMRLALPRLTDLRRQNVRAMAKALLGATV